MSDPIIAVITDNTAVVKTATVGNPVSVTPTELADLSATGADAGDVLVADGNGGASWTAHTTTVDVESLTTNNGSATNYVRVKSGGGLEYRDAASVVGDIGAAASAHAHAADTLQSRPSLGGNAAAASTVLTADGNGASSWAAITSSQIATATDVYESFHSSPVTATTQNVYVDMDVAVTVPAGTYMVDARYKATNASSSSAQFAFTVSANLGMATGEDIGHNLRAGDNAVRGWTVNSATELGGTVTSAAQYVVAEGFGILVFTGTATVTMKIRNTAATGTVTTKRGCMLRLRRIGAQ